MGQQTNERNIIIKDKATVKIGNKIVRANYKFSILQARMNNAFLSLIDRENGAFDVCSVSVDRLAELMQLPDDGHRLSIIRRITTSIGGAFFSWAEVDKSDGDCGSIPWFSFVKFSKLERTVSWQYNAALGSELLLLRRDYTPEELMKLQKFKFSTYSDSVMKLILMHVTNGDFEDLPYYSLEVLRDKLVLSPKSYPKYSNLRVRVLEPIEKDINEFSDYKFKFIPVYNGRKVVGVKFDIKKKFIKTTIFDNEPWRKDIKEKLLSVGVDFYKAVSIAKNKNYTQEYFQANIKRWERAKNLNDPAAALVYYIAKNKAGYQISENIKPPEVNKPAEPTEAAIKDKIEIEISLMRLTDRKKLIDDVINKLTLETNDKVYDIYKSLLLSDDAETFEQSRSYRELLIGYVYRLRYPNSEAKDPDVNFNPGQFDI